MRVSLPGILIATIASVALWGLIAGVAICVGSWT